MISWLVLASWEAGKPPFFKEWPRLWGEKEALAAGFGENLLDRAAVVAVEWAENALKALPEKRIEVHFEYGEKEKERKIKIIRKNC